MIYVNLKSIGKRKPALARVPYAIPTESVNNLRTLITAIVEAEVHKYNSKQNDTNLLTFLTEEEINDQAQTGKVSFGEIYSDKKANVSKSTEVALQGFEDGLFRVVLNDTEITTLDEHIELNAGDTLTFIRLTFLTGSFW